MEQWPKSVLKKCWSHTHKVSCVVAVRLHAPDRHLSVLDLEHVVLSSPAQQRSPHCAVW